MAFTCLTRTKNTQAEPLVPQQKVMASLTVSFQSTYLKTRDCIVAVRKPNAGVRITASYIKQNGVWEPSAISGIILE